MSENYNMMSLIKKNKGDIGAYGGLIVCIVFFTIVPPFFGESIWTGAKLATLMSNVIVLALMAVGAIFIYSLGNMDISIGKQVGLYATLIVLLGNKTGSIIPGIIVSISIGLVIAIINGAAGQVLKIHPIVSSLVFRMILSGVSSIVYTFIGTRSITLKTIDYSAFKNPWIMILALIIEILVIGYLLNYTKFGKYAKAIGANQVSAEQCGINLLKYKVISYIIMSFPLVLAALFQMGYTGSASDSTGTGFEMNVMVALILGGMPLSGGMKSRVSYAVIGAFTFSLLSLGLPLIGVKPNQTFIIKAVIFLIVVLITSRKSKGLLPR